MRNFFQNFALSEDLKTSVFFTRLGSRAAPSALANPKPQPRNPKPITVDPSQHDPKPPEAEARHGLGTQARALSLFFAGLGFGGLGVYRV